MTDESVPTDPERGRVQPGADRFHFGRADGPGLVARFPGMAYQCRNDRAWTVDFASAGALELTGYSSAQLIAEDGVEYADLIHDEDRERVWNEVQSAVRTDRGFEIEYRIHTPHVGERWVHERGHPVWAGEGELLGLEGFILDVTHRRDLETQLQVAQKREALAELTGTVTHDFNNFLTAILGAVDLAVADLPEDSPALRSLELATATVERARTLTLQLLSFSRTRPVALRTFDLNRAVAEMGVLLKQLVGSPIRLDVELYPDVLPVRADPSKLDQVLMNLVVNARDAMPLGGSMVLRTSRSDRKDDAMGEGVLELIDTGEGIEEEHLETIFEPFFTTKSGGTGLGLSMVRRIVEEAGGTIDVASPDGDGATFRVVLPLVAPDGIETESPAIVKRRPPGGASQRVLVVEDDDAVRKVVETALTRNGYDVVAVRSAAAALQRAREPGWEPALAIIDFSLPDLDGVALAAELETAWPEIAILLSSGFVSEEVVRAGSGIGSASFLEKPFSVDQLLAAVRAGLGSRGSRSRQ